MVSKADEYLKSLGLPEFKYKELSAIIAEYRKLLASEIWFHKDNLAIVDLTV
uniref:GST C-terminal domain-containing protein n=1 Tax=Leersia perrieri TaxID=77586 RepID=A0A0D9WF87_9ORYZ